MLKGLQSANAAELASGANAGNSSDTRTRVAPAGVSSDIRNSPPKSLIAAGRMAVSAYWIGQWGTVQGNVKRLHRTWYLHNPRSGSYEATPWSWLDVAPGLKFAAVLDGELPSKRLGILDVSTGNIVSWINLGQPAGSVAWSPDGSKILATTYTSHPDEAEFFSEALRRHKPSTRTGFYIVNTADKKTKFNKIASERSGGTRQDFKWESGDAISAPSFTSSNGKSWRSLDGQLRAPFGATAAGDEIGAAGISPNGKLVAGAPGLPTQVRELATDQAVGTQPVLQLLAWADDDHLIALGCEGACSNEFRNGLVLVSVDGKQVTQLSSYRKDGAADEDWHPVLTVR
ncbi:hypothetical protein GCM10017600_06960 [Streptosporangium carneum]|uniref:WD40 repeat domain-containing protein n=2 Tax=Streptosporangium carneum TaxID=47481 RepID=A0A9W6HVU9_9ACTN|nr:hypothetical protein GCM10017600_06960 [Streptosporangium carneum]